LAFEVGDPFGLLSVLLVESLILPTKSLDLRRNISPRRDDRLPSWWLRGPRV
jgi:hypothetical protein